MEFSEKEKKEIKRDILMTGVYFICFGFIEMVGIIFGIVLTLSLLK